MIGQAKGVVMERFGLDDHQAFNLLVRYSQHTNTKLHDVAQEVTAGPVRRARSRRDGGQPRSVCPGVTP